MSVEIDDQPANGVLSLATGMHHYRRSGEGGKVAIHWIGPDEKAAHEAIKGIVSLGRGEPMFTNMPTEIPHE